jgi:flagellar L-ring protein precursor FlgH
MLRPTLLPLLFPLLLAAGLPACTNTLARLQNVGNAPPMSPIENPAAANPAVTMPMPQPVEVERQPSSLWRPGARAFFKDQRAAQVGDILTVTINIADTATLDNTTSRSRSNSENAAIPQFLGYDVSRVVKRLPGLNQSADPSNLVEMTSSASSSGTGSIERSETITLRVAAVVTQVLPNGNLVIEGKQEVRVNFEVRELVVAGIVRPEDIESDNTIESTKIAQARIAYGGRGQITDVQQPRYGQQVMDILLPF